MIESNSFRASGLALALAQIRALAAMQWRSFSNSLRDRARRHGTAITVAVAGLWYGLWLAVALGAVWAPRFFERDQAETTLLAVFVAAMGWWQLTPLVSMSLGVSLDLPRLARFPVAPPALFLFECLLRLWTGLEVALVLAGLYVGLLAAPWATAGGATLGVGLFVALNVFLSAAIRNAAERAFRRRHLREAFVAVLLSSIFFPQAIFGLEALEEWVDAGGLSRAGGLFGPTPLGAAARLAAGAGGWTDAAWLTAAAAAAAAAGYAAFRGWLRTAAARAAADVAPAARGLGAVLRRLPAAIARPAPDPLAALVEKELRYLWRSAKSRFAFFLGFGFGPVAWASVLSAAGGAAGETARGETAGVAAIYALLLLAPSAFANRFGFDRAAARAYFWMPAGFGRALAAKNLASAVFAAAQTALTVATCAALGLAAGGRSLAEASCAALATLPWLLALGNRSSVLDPIPSNPDRLSRGVASGRRALTDSLLVPLATAPAVLALSVKLAPGGEALVWPALAAAFGGGLAAYAWATRAAVREAERRRERFLARLTEGDGAFAAE